MGILLWVFASRYQEEAPSDAAALAFGIVFTLVILAIVVLTAAGMWKAFAKAGKPGWAAIVPIYNMIVILQIAGKPIWWLILYLIPLVNVIVVILVGIGVARNFGKGTGFGIGLAALGPIFYPILGFGDAQYRPQS
ncbi:MAG: DUF5684 domain-containing protein [Thermoanaerobaculia bacterium]